MTKQQLFEALKSSTLVGYEARLVYSSDNYKGFKDELAWQMNKFSCISRQTTKDVQFYLGDMYRYSSVQVEKYIQSLHKLASSMGYELYSPNGYWFIKSK
jgi:hypothetical protein